MAACGLWLLPLRRSGVGSLEAWEDFSSHPPPLPLPLNAMPSVDATIQDGRGIQVHILPGLKEPGNPTHKSHLPRPQVHDDKLARAFIPTPLIHLRQEVQSRAVGWCLSPVGAVVPCWHASSALIPLHLTDSTTACPSSDSPAYLSIPAREPRRGLFFSSSLVWPLETLSFHSLDELFHRPRPIPSASHTLPLVHFFCTSHHCVYSVPWLIDTNFFPFDP